MTQASASPGVTPLPVAEPAADWTQLALPPLARVASFEATKTSAAGVLLDTAFRLTSLDGRDPAALAGHLVTDPPIVLRVARTDGTTVTVSPSAPLRAGTHYRIRLQEPGGTTSAAWAVQAVGPIHVVSTIPGDESTNVPTDTGIELTFDQDGVALADVERLVSLAPSTPGHFVQSGRKVAYVPDHPLATATLYTVTVRHGLPLQGTPMTLDRDVTFAFETGGAPATQAHLTFVRTLMDVGTREQPAMTIHVDRFDDDDNDMPVPESVDATVHRLAGIDAAVDAWRKVDAAPTWTTFGGSAPIETSGLPRVLGGTLRLQSMGQDYDYLRWIQLPSTLDAGWYVVTLASGGTQRQAILQVTDVAAYTVVSRTRTAAWVNDLATKGPIAGASVAIAGKGIGRTNAEGVLLAATPAAVTTIDDADPRAVLVARAGARAVFVPTNGVLCAKCDAAGNASPAYWTLFQSDRYRYRASDTVTAWAVVRRQAGAVPSGVEVRLVAEPGDDLETVAAIASATAPPDKGGAATLRLRFTDLPAGYYQLQLRVGRTVVAIREIAVGPIAKPDWQLTLRTSKHAVIDGTRVGVTAHASFFEGTPVAGVRLDLAVNDSDSTGRITTNADGTGSTRIPLRLDGSNDPWTITSLNARPTEPEEGEISQWANVAVFRSSILLRTGASVSGSTLTVRGTVNDVAFSRFERPGVNLDAVDPYGKRRGGVTVRVRIVEHIPVLVQTGTTYDFITKRVVPSYEINERTVTVGTRSVRSASDGTFRFSLAVAGGHRSYETTATAADAAGRSIESEAWAYGEPAASTQTDPPMLVAAAGSPERYSVGDTVSVAFTGGTSPTKNARYLFSVARDGLRTVALTDTPRFRTAFRASDVRGMTVLGVRFTGSGYEASMSDFTAAFDLDDRRLDVAITPDHASYAPGGRATLAVRTTGPGGRPVAASVFVRMVDEKLYAIGAATDEDPLSELYAEIGPGIEAVAWSHGAIMPEGEGGDTTGGGGDDDRADFRDYLLAKVVRTNALGRGSLSFDLSDDLTSWRATGSAVAWAGSAPMAGTGRADLRVRLPFFAQVTVAPEYLVGERPILRLRGYGAGLATGDVVTFTVTSDTLPMAPVTVRARAFRAAEVPLPALASAGTQRIRVAATVAGDPDRHDAVVRTFRVVTTRAVQATTTWSILHDPMSFDAAAGSTTLVLADAGRGRVIPVLQELAWAPTARGDQVLAAGLATRVLRDDFGLRGDAPAPDDALAAYDRSDGIALVPYGSADLELAVVAAMSKDPRLDLDQLAESFHDSAGDAARETQLWVLAGRAASGEAVLGDLQAAADLPDLTATEQVVIALGAMSAGDDDLAGRLEREVLTAHGQRKGRWVRLEVGSADEDAVLTARLAIVAASLGDPVAADMDAYLDANPPKTTLVVLERALAARAWADRVPGSTAEAALTIDGVQTTLRIQPGAPRTIVLAPAQAAAARLAPVSGSVLVTTSREAALDVASIVPPAGTSLTRNVRPARDIEATTTVVVTLTVRFGDVADRGCWNLTDFAPSGLVPIGLVGQWADPEEEGPSASLGPTRVVGQRVDFCVSPDEHHPTQTLRYIARVVTPGTYRWEPAVLQSTLIPTEGAVVPARNVTILGSS